MNEANDMIIPPFAALTFLYADTPICSIPSFILVNLAIAEGEDPESCNLLSDLSVAPDHVANDATPRSADEILEYLQRVIRWEQIESYLSCPNYMLAPLGEVWSRTENDHSELTIRFTEVLPPETLYRYMPFNPERSRVLLASSQIFLPSPSMFNDPFDCSLDEPTRLTFIESAVGCFSKTPDNVLMFSHNADNHKGICVGFNTRRLIQSLSHSNHPFQASLRPVWYFANMPLLTLGSQPALCATCKHDIWRYENEFRIFMNWGSSLAPRGTFTFERDSITEIIFGCEATGQTVSDCKSLTIDLPGCTHRKAFREPNRFGLSLHEIHRL